MRWREVLLACFACGQRIHARTFIDSNRHQLHRVSRGEPSSAETGHSAGTMLVPALSKGLAMLLSTSDAPVGWQTSMPSRGAGCALSIHTDRQGFQRSWRRVGEPQMDFFEDLKKNVEGLQKDASALVDEALNPFDDPSLPPATPKPGPTYDPATQKNIFDDDFDDEAALQKLRNSQGPAPVFEPYMPSPQQYGRTQNISKLPDSLAAAVEGAVRALRAAEDNQLKNVVIEFEQEYDPQGGGIEVTRAWETFVEVFLPYFAASCLDEPTYDEEGWEVPRIQVIFPDMGKAAYYTQKSSLPIGTFMGAIQTARITPGVEAILAVAPGAYDRNYFQALMNKVAYEMPDVPVIVFNPQWFKMEKAGDAYRQFMQWYNGVFKPCYVLKAVTLADGQLGYLYHVYPEGYSLYVENPALNQIKGKEMDEAFDAFMNPTVDLSDEPEFVLAYHWPYRPSEKEIRNKGPGGGGAEKSPFEGFLEQITTL